MHLLSDCSVHEVCILSHFSSDFRIVLMVGLPLLSLCCIMLSNTYLLASSQALACLSHVLHWDQVGLAKQASDSNMHSFLEPRAN